MRFHVVGLPHTQTTKAYETCAFTSNVRMFCTMMHQRGHEVFLYAGEENEAEVTHHVKCITKRQQALFGYGTPQAALGLDYNEDPIWPVFNQQVIEHMRSHMRPHDFICVITGDPAALPIIEAFPGHMTVEYAVGYKGLIAQSNTHHRVFCSRAWQNYCYGIQDSEGFFYDEVIPHFFETEDFPAGSGDGDYFAFVGRINAWKGLDVAQAVCEKLGKRLLVAGQGSFSGYGEYVGIVDSKQRAQLLGGAIATFCPTVYVEPFGKVAVESLLCGTPIITTPWGAFPEMITTSPRNGWACGDFGEFVAAAKLVDSLNRDRIRHEARVHYSTVTVAERYERYFEKLLTLWGPGWYGKLET